MWKFSRKSIQFLCFALCVNIGNSHPLDPLSRSEIAATKKIIEAYDSEVSGWSWVYNWITLQEPPKALLLPYFINDTESDISPLPLEDIPRKSFTVLVRVTTNTVVQVVVNLNTETVESWEEQPEGTQTTYRQEYGRVTSAVKNDERIIERCRQMGWDDMNLVVAESWSPGYIKDGPALQTSSRPLIVYFYGQMFWGDNHYAHPFDFLAIVDYTTGEVKEIRNLPSHSDYDADNREGNVCPKKTSNYNPSLKPEGFVWRKVSPVLTSQPDGPGYHLNGNELCWQKYKMRIGFNGREGLVIHQVSYNDNGTQRALFYRMSVAEMFVPYGDPRPPYQQKLPVDVGQFSLGYTAINLQATKLCAGGGVVAYLDVPLSATWGYAYTARKVVCVYEEDAGILWAHRKRSMKVVSTRNTRLTITSMSNLGNYDYKFIWHFYMDGTIEFKGQLHGIVSTNLVAQNVTNTGGFGTLVSPSVNAQYHQHFFGLRLDAEIDGNLNNVAMKDIVPLSDPTGSPKNPYGNGFVVNSTVLKTPSEARTKINPETGRSWFMQNPKKMHPYAAAPVAYKLTPFSAPLPFMKKDSPMHPKTAWADYNVWVTKYKDGQLYPGGFYLNGSDLPQWVAEDPDADLTMTDVVLWYVFGSTHITRTEDFPIMPAETIGFSIKPVNFFLKNPALDVPPPPPA